MAGQSAGLFTTDWGPRVADEDNYDGGEITIEFLGPAGPFTINASTFTAMPTSSSEEIRTVTMFRPFDTRQQACDEMLTDAQRFGLKLTETKAWCNSDRSSFAGDSGGIGGFALPMSVDANASENVVMLHYHVFLDSEKLTPSECETHPTLPGYLSHRTPRSGKGVGDSHWTH